MWAFALFKWLNLDSVLAKFTDKNLNSAAREFYSVSRVFVLLVGFMFCFNLSSKEILVFNKVCRSKLLSFTENRLLRVYLNTLLVAETLAAKVRDTFLLRMFRLIGKMTPYLLYRIWDRYSCAFMLVSIEPFSEELTAYFSDSSSKEEKFLLIEFFTYVFNFTHK